MRTFLSYFFGLISTLIALFIIPVDRLFDETMDTQKLIENVRTAGIYEQMSKLTAQKILEQKPIQNIRKSSLMPTEEEMQKVVKDVFPEEWFLNNIGAVHRDMIGFMADPVMNKYYFVGVILSDRKNMLTEELALFMESKINALPECTPQDLMKMRMPLLNIGADGFLKNFELTCKPPDQVRNLILKNVRKDLDKAMSALPDSLSFLKQDYPSKKGFDLEELKSIFFFSESFAAVGYGTLFFLLIVIGLINRKEIHHLLKRIGFPFILTALFMSIPFFILISNLDKIFAMPTMQFRHSGTSIDPISDEAKRLVISFIRSSAEHYSWNMIYLCGLLFLIGVTLLVVSRIVKLEPLSPLDQRHETNL